MTRPVSWSIIVPSYNHNHNHNLNVTPFTSHKPTLRSRTYPPPRRTPTPTPFIPLPMHLLSTSTPTILPIDQQPRLLDQPVKQTLLFKQLLRGSELGHLSLIQHHDPV